MGETRTRRRTHQRDDLAPRSACWAVVSTPRSTLSWRETVEGSLSHVRSAVRVRIGVALAETAETSRTVRQCAFTSGVHCTALISVALAEIAEIRRECMWSLRRDSGYAYPSVHARRILRVMLFYSRSATESHEDRTEDCRRVRRAHRHPA